MDDPKTPSEEAAPVSDRMLAIHDLATARLRSSALELDPNTAHDLREIARLSKPPPPPPADDVRKDLGGKNECG